MLADFVSKAVLSLAIGGLIGLEREHAKQIVGVRTFALTSLLGFLLAFQKSELFTAVGLAGVFAFSALYYYFKAKRVPEGWGVTTPLMLPFAFLMGALVGYDYALEAGMLTVAAVFLLVEKSSVHAIANRVSKQEVIDLLIFAVIAFIIYPQLPVAPIDFFSVKVDLHFFWTAVVLITAISFIAHVLLKYVGQKALLYATFLGGAVSSLATVALFSRKTGDHKLLRMVLLNATAGSSASDITFLALIAPGLLLASLPLNAVFLLGLLAAGCYYLRKSSLAAKGMRSDRDPLSLLFIIELAAAIFAVNLLMGFLAKDTAGLYAGALLGGLASSTAVFASVAYLYNTQAIAPQSAVVALFLAIFSSLAVKTLIAARSAEKRIEIIKPAVVALACASLGLYLNLFIR